MKNILNILYSAARARIMPLWIKLRMWTSPTFIKTQVLSRIREFFSRLLDIRPKHKRDYYGIFNWLVSKRLAFALVVALGLGASLYIVNTLPESFFGGSGESIPTYKYRSIPLKFYSGSVRIQARKGYIAYDGQVENGAASGEGVLYNADGITVYEGQFSDNMYNGNGVLYYSNGTPRYMGSFTDNEFNGTGSYFRSNGVLEYAGDYVSGTRTGMGTLYDSVGSAVFQGKFLNNEIVYTDFLARPTSEIAALYSGETEIWQSDAEYCVAMPEIDAVYSVKDGSNTIENEWTVNRIYVLRDSIPLESGTCMTVRQLQEALGQPLYFGTAWINLPEAVAWNQLAQEQPDRVVPVNITASTGLENVHAVSAYDRDYQLYLYTYEQAGMLYTFYFTGAGESTFVMYSVEKA